LLSDKIKMDIDKFKEITIKQIQDCCDYEELTTTLRVACEYSQGEYIEKECR